MWSRYVLRLHLVSRGLNSEMWCWAVSTVCCCWNRPIVHIPEEQKKMEFVVTSRILWYFYKHQFKLIMNEWSYTSVNPICLHGMDKEFAFLRIMHFIWDLPHFGEGASGNALHDLYVLKCIQISMPYTGFKLTIPTFVQCQATLSSKHVVTEISTS